MLSSIAIITCFFSLICIFYDPFPFIIYLIKERDQLPDGLSDANKAKILKYIKEMRGKFTVIIAHDTISDEISNFLFLYIYNIYI